MKWMLRLAGKARNRFSQTPHWVRDAYGLLSPLNFVELVPTVGSIALAPRHFFRRLPSTLAGHRPHYQTPVKFFFHFAALFMAMFYLRNGDMRGVMDEGEAVMLLPLIIPMMPPLMIVLGLVTWVLYQLPRLAPNGDAFPPPNPGPFKLLLHPRTYTRLDAARYGWGLFYIGIYFLAAWQVVQLLLSMNLLGVAYLASLLGSDNVIAQGVIVLLGVALAALCIHGFVLAPYVELLRTSLRRPTRAVFETDVNDIARQIDEFLATSPDDPSIQSRAEMLGQWIQTESRRLSRVVSQQDQDYYMTDGDRKERLDVHRDAFRVSSLRTHLKRIDSSIGTPIDQALSRLEPATAIEIKRAA